MSLEKQIAQKIRSKMTRANLKKIEERFLQEADKLKNQNTQSGNAPSDRSIYIRPLSKQYARKTGKSYANMRGRTNNIERTTINSDNKSSTLRFNDTGSSVIFNYHDKGTAKGGKKREIYPKIASAIDPRLRNVIRGGIKALYNG